MKMNKLAIHSYSIGWSESLLRNSSHIAPVCSGRVPIFFFFFLTREHDEGERRSPGADPTAPPIPLLPLRSANLSVHCRYGPKKKKIRAPALRRPSRTSGLDSRISSIR